MGNSTFTPGRTPYTTEDGRKLVLVLDYYNGFKAYWVEDEAGKRLVRPRFYNPFAVSGIVSPEKPCTL